MILSFLIFCVYCNDAKSHVGLQSKAWRVWRCKEGGHRRVCAAKVSIDISSLHSHPPWLPRSVLVASSMAQRSHPAALGSEGHRFRPRWDECLSVIVKVYWCVQSQCLSDCRLWFIPHHRAAGGGIRPDHHSRVAGPAPTPTSSSSSSLFQIFMWSVLIFPHSNKSGSNNRS